MHKEIFMSSPGIFLRTDCNVLALFFKFSEVFVLFHMSEFFSLLKRNFDLQAMHLTSASNPHGGRVKLFPSPPSAVTAATHRIVATTLRFILLLSLLIVVCFLFAAWKLPLVETKSFSDKGLQWSSLQLPIFPSMKTDNLAEVSAIKDLFRYTMQGGWINVNALQNKDISILRNIGRDIMGRNTSCGHPKVLSQEVATGLEYCFWEGDLVSAYCMMDFSFETLLWSWVIREFRDLGRNLRATI